MIFSILNAVVSIDESDLVGSSHHARCKPVKSDKIVEHVGSLENSGEGRLLFL